MREFFLLKQINESYKKLNLKYSKLIISLILMFLTAILEMSGLSILYPMVLFITNSMPMENNFFSFLPFPFEYQVLLLFGSIALLYIIKNITLYFSYEYNINFARYYYKNLIKGLYKVFIYKPLLEFKEESAGSLANIICVQSSRLVDGVIRPLLVIVTELFVLLGISSLVLFICPELISAIVIICGLTVTLYYLALRKKALHWGKTRMEAATLMQELVSNSSVGIAEIKIFGKEQYLISKVHETSEIETNMFHRLEMYQQTPRFLLETFFIITILSILSTTFLMGITYNVLLAKFSLLGASAFRILPSINRIINSYSSFSFNVIPALSLMKIIGELDLNFEQKLNKEILSTKFVAKIIDIRNLSFKYPNINKDILKNVNMKILKGQHIGLIGSSGSGKSTLIKILAGLYHPISGTILVDNRDIFQELSEWHLSIGYVPQDSFIMPGTLRENLCFGTKTVLADEKLWQIVQKVALLECIQSLPNGLDTNIGEKGILLSGGQKQLICLARALLREPAVLFLDEPTASLDAKNEEIVLQVINGLLLETTVIMVSHKYLNFKNFDRIFVCENESIREHVYSEQVESLIL